jgi:alkaline phosphatase D
MSQHDPSRRLFLNRLSLAAGTVATVSPLAALADAGGDTHVWAGRRRLVRPGRAFFPQSVASFEPREDSVILWTRAVDADAAGQDLDLVVLVGTDPWLRRLVAATDLRARASDDGVVQVKLTGLKPRTQYFYRFVLARGGEWFGSALARTRTAPRATDDSPARFAFASCQDAVGRYFNSYWRVLPEDLDFVVHLGDYIYETTGDPSFQSTTGRGVRFSDEAGAVALRDAPGNPFFAAASVSNYRELHQFYRGDSVLQRMHERFPFVMIWDDHEFANDCWGATATDFNGLKDELSVQRRRNAERVYFEYVPVDIDLPTGAVDPSAQPVYPATRLYRDFRWGANLHLVLTDSRTFRPDHLIPEDAFPGTIAVARGPLSLLLSGAGTSYDAAKESFAPYLDIDNPPSAELAPLYGAWKAVLTQVLAGAYIQQGLAAPQAGAKAAGNIRGNLDATVVNTLLASYNALPGVTPVPPVSAALISTLDRGISYALMGKSALFSSLGSRYFVVKATYDLFAAARSVLTGDASAENAYGRDQLAWLESVLRTTDARWKVVANSTSLTSMVLDLTGTAPGLPQPIRDALSQLPPLLRNRFYLNVDQFDGFPNFRRRLLDLYASIGGVALIAGDIHASFVNDHPGGTVEFTGPAVSSFAFAAGVESTVKADPLLASIPGLSALVAQLDLLLKAGNPQMRHVNTGVNGIVVVEAGANGLKGTYYEIAATEALTDYGAAPWRLIGRFAKREFTAAAPAMSLAPVGDDAIA